MCVCVCVGGGGWSQRWGYQKNKLHLFPLSKYNKILRFCCEYFNIVVKLIFKPYRIIMTCIIRVTVKTHTTYITKGTELQPRLGRVNPGWWAQPSHSLVRDLYQMHIYIIRKTLIWAQGSQRNLENLGDLNFICPGPVIAWHLCQNVRKPGQKRKIVENRDKTWNVKIYNISILYWDNFFHILCWCKFKMPLVSAFLVPKLSAL